MGDHQSVDQLASFFTPLHRISCSVIMPIRLPAICDYHQPRSPLEKGAAKGWDRRKRQLSDFCMAREENCWKIGILQIAVM